MADRPNVGAQQQRPEADGLIGGSPAIPQQDEAGEQNRQERERDRPVSEAAPDGETLPAEQARYSVDIGDVGGDDEGGGGARRQLLEPHLREERSGEAVGEIVHAATTPPSLRAQRSNPCRHLRYPPSDCFVASFLATTTPHLRLANQMK
jgi:hypothetical protein